MISEDSFFELLRQEIRRLSIERGLTETETGLLETILRQTLADPFLDERHIYSRISEPREVP